MAFNVNLKVCRKRTLVYLGLLVAGSAASQSAWVENHVKPLAATHPHLAFVAPLLLAIITLLHNPQIAAAITQSLQDDPPAEKTQ